ncbi:hypothetical protein [uncultured Sphingomonas sp.]|uniref:hypothetical protein n=1 Tax=uncultured Sphingomonas sp. TaxID=158754 RepID=UPI0035C96681
MRLVLVLGAAALSAGCGEKASERAAADAHAAGFTPPAVTSRLDWGGQQERRFTTLDRNADDKLTADEFPRVDSRLARADANGDGEITKTEFTTAAMGRFDRMDINRDGTVTSEEQDTTRNGTIAAD